MRRAQQEITDRAEVERLLSEAEVLHLGLYDGHQVYVVPMNYGYRDNALYLHSALEGRKIEILRASPDTCFTIMLDARVKPAEKPCGWSTDYTSLIGYGQAVFLDSPEEKADGLTALMDRFSPGPHDFDEDALARTAVIRIDISEVTGKRH